MWLRCIFNYHYLPFEAMMVSERTFILLNLYY